MSGESRYLTPDEVAAELRFKTARPIYKAIRRGELKALEISRQFRVVRETWRRISRAGAGGGDRAAAGSAADAGTGS